MILYSTVGCHLCDLAQEVIFKTLGYNTRFETVDIADDDALLAQYGEKIPVLRKRSGGECLHWPFDCEQLREWYFQAN